MGSRQLSPSNRPHVFDWVAFATTVSLVSTVAFLQVKVLPFYVAVMASGGFEMPFPQRAATWVCNFTVRYLLAGFFVWAVFALWRSVRSPRPVAFPRPQALAIVNVAAVVLLMGQVSGFVGFAMHGLKAAHNVITAHEQRQTRPGIQPPSLRQQQPR